MKKIELLSRIGVALAATTLVGASVFAESRPSNETRGHRREGGRIERGSAGERSSAWHRDDSSNASRQSEANIERRSQRSEVRGERSTRNEERDRSYRESDRNRDQSQQRYNNDRSNRQWRDRGNNDRYNGSRSNDRYRSNDRNRSYGHSSSSYGYRQPYYGHGRISRVLRYGGGYRIWVVGTPYPFYIPLAYYRHDRFRIGLSINLGGYYNSGGYYDYYDGYDGYNDGRSDGAIRGVIESVDYRDGSFVVRNDATDSFVTVYSRGRRTDVRAGDYVELLGEWTRTGVFTAYDVNFLEDEYRR